MLQKPGVRAVHDGAALFMLQKHANNGGLRHKRMHAAKDALKAFAGNDFGKEAGAVMVINAFNAGLNLFAAEGGGVYGKIAALGVAANAEPSAEGIRSRAEILHRLPSVRAQRRKLMLKSSFHPTSVPSVPRNAT